MCFDPTKRPYIKEYHNEYHKDPCLLCGGKVRILDGRYRVDRKGNAVILAGPDTTLISLEHIRITNELKKLNFTTPEAFFEQAGKISPAIKMVLDDPTVISQIRNILLNPALDVVLKIIGIVIAALALNQSQGGSSTVNYNTTTNNYITVSKDSLKITPHPTKAKNVIKKKKRGHPAEAEVDGIA